jgi:hypothetical protein
MKKLIALLVFSCITSSLFASHTWVGPFELKEVSYDQDDFPKKRIEVKVVENANFYRFVTNDATYPQSDADGLKSVLSILLSAQSQKKKVFLLCENLDAVGNWRFVGVKF